jgi:hypothetical protein
MWEEMGQIWGCLRKYSPQNIGRNREKATGGWKQLHSEKFHAIEPSPTITNAIQLRKMRRVATEED